MNNPPTHDIKKSGSAKDLLAFSPFRGPASPRRPFSGTPSRLKTSQDFGLEYERASHHEQSQPTNPAALNITEDGGRGPLHVASARCCTNVIALLLQKGAKIELKGKTGETPLHVAAQEGCVDAVTMLVNKGANINARDNEGHTPLKRALDYQQNATADLLRKLGAVEN